MSLSILGCRETATLFDLRSAEPWAAAVLLSGPEDAPTATAVALEGGAKVVEISQPPDEDTETLVLFYRLPLASLALVEGPLERTPDKVGRHLPVPSRAISVELSRFASAVGPGETTTATTSPLYEAFLLPAPPLEVCLAARGCYPAEAGGECVTPCPEGTRPIAPTPPELPRFSCDRGPAVSAAELGVSSPELQGLSVCFPPPIAACPAGQLWTPELGCRDAVPSCSGWPEDLPADALYVRAGARDGDGSAGAPFATLAEAIAATGVSSRPRVVALGAGAHAGDVELAGALRLRGCGAALRGRIHVRSGATRLEGLILQGGSLVEVDASGGLELAHVRVEPTSTVATVFAISGTTTVSDGLLDLGLGSIEVAAGGQLTLRHSQARNHAHALVRVFDAGWLRAVDVALSGPADSEPLVVVSGEARLDRARIESESEPGLSFRGTSRGTLEQVAVHGPGAAALLTATERARVIGDEVALVEGRQGLSMGMDSRVALTDVIIRGEFGVLLADRSDLALTRALVLGPDGLVLHGATKTTLTDVSVVNTNAGLLADEETTVTARRLQLLDAFAYGGRIGGASVHHLSDVIVRRAGALGFAVMNPQGLIGPNSGVRAVADIERIAVSEGGGAGIWVAQRSTVNLRDARVENIRLASVEACDQVRAAFIFAVCEGEAVSLANHAFGTLERFELSGSRRGLVVGAQGYQVASGRIFGNEIGFVLLDDLIKPEAVLDRVAFESNQVDLARNTK